MKVFDVLVAKVHSAAAVTGRIAQWWNAGAHTTSARGHAAEARARWLAGAEAR